MDPEVINTEPSATISDEELKDQAVEAARQRVVEAASSSKEMLGKITAEQTVPGASLPQPDPSTKVDLPPPADYLTPTAN